MKIRILADTSIKGAPAFTGDICEVDDADGNLLISYKLAEPAKEDEPRKSIKEKKDGKNS